MSLADDGWRRESPPLCRTQRRDRPCSATVANRVGMDCSAFVPLLVQAAPARSGGCCGDRRVRRPDASAARMAA
jgi:hypothetical protein